MLFKNNEKPEEKTKMLRIIKNPLIQIVKSPKDEKIKSIMTNNALMKTIPGLGEFLVSIGFTKKTDVKYMFEKQEIIEAK